MQKCLHCNKTSLQVPQKKPVCWNCIPRCNSKQQIVNTILLEGKTLICFKDRCGDRSRHVWHSWSPVQNKEITVDALTTAAGYKDSVRGFCSPESVLILHLLPCMLLYISSVIDGAESGLCGLSCWAKVCCFYVRICCSLFFVPQFQSHRGS